MKMWFPLVLFICGLLLSSTPGAAQDPAGVSPPASTLAQFLKRIAAVDQALLPKIEALKGTIDAEAAANRVSEPIARSLRWSLNNARLSSGADFHTVITANRLPFENGTLIEGFQTLEHEWTAAQAQRVALIRDGAGAARAALAEVLRTAEKPADIDPLLNGVERLLELAMNRSNTTLSAINAHGLQSHPAFLRALRQLLEPSTDPATAGAAMSEFQSSIYSVRAYVREADVQARMQRTLAPFLKALEDAEQALDRVFLEGKTAAEFNDALARFEQAAERHQQARGNVNIRPPVDASQRTGVYRNLGLVKIALDKGDFPEAKNQLGNLRPSNLQVFGATRAAQYGALVGGWKTKIEEGLQQAEEKRRQDLRARLDAVRTPADLEALSAALYQEERGERSDRDHASFRGLAAHLGTLAAAWSSASPALITRQHFEDPSDARLGTELGSLRQRIERDVLAKILRAPELQQTPLADLPLDAALDRLAGQLAAKGEWRRLLQLVEGRSTATRHDGAPTRETDLASALRSFLAAQNLELAEQWSDAIQSYKAVLRSASERAPIKDAAARVKALAEAHPEAAAPAAPVPAAGLRLPPNP